MGKEMNAENRIAVFENREIRKTFHNGEWWFSVVDVIGALTGSDNPRDYWYKMKIRVKSEDGVELSTNCRQLKLQASDGKMRSTDCSNTESILRLIQSIPSPKAEPFKLWLAKEVGDVAGNARMELESKTGKKISTDENYIDVPEKVKRLKGKK